MYERGLSLFYEQSEKSMSGTSRILPAAEYAGAGNETKNLLPNYFGKCFFALILYYFSTVLSKEDFTK